jgi:hypothetical protein
MIAHHTGLLLTAKGEARSTIYGGQQLHLNAFIDDMVLLYSKITPLPVMAGMDPGPPTTWFKYILAMAQKKREEQKHDKFSFESTSATQSQDKKSLRRSH